MSLWALRLWFRFLKRDVKDLYRYARRMGVVRALKLFRIKRQFAAELKARYTSEKIATMIRDPFLALLKKKGNP